MDHTELDIELISLKTGKPLGRPWLSLAIDAHTRRIVGIYLSFAPPSYRSNMMLLRDIVRRHRRLPQFIVVDNGSDFRSDDFTQFAALMRIHVRYRPAGRPRHGSVMERIFGRLHTEYVHNLAGNTKALKDVRQTTGKFLPSRLAEWTLDCLYYGVEYWAFHQNTLGCIGILRDVLVRLDLLVGRQGWSEDTLCRALLTEAQVTQILREIMEGEERIAPGLKRTLITPQTTAGRRVA